mmetsp:Transcript_1622/g.4008  ORF Transcript_1622/g.4008 Transcript_1622/m.4008 type:complete len:150 (-) Transcript_1622:17-466(-)
MFFYLFFIPLALGVHHSAPDPCSREAEDLQSGEHPRNTFAWMEGQRGACTDFGEHMVAACTDYAVLSKDLPAFLRDWLSLTLFGYLNNHTLHHLFPGVDQSRLHMVHDVLEETAREFGLDPNNVKQYTIPAIARGWYRYNLDREVRPKL